MGASQGREGTDASGGGARPIRPGAISPSSKNVVQPPAQAQALHALLNPARTEHHSLDRTLKGFLKHCKLGGLEYRLRLAGIYTLEDLVHTDETKLCRHGFTQLMAKRLYDSLDEYLSEPDDIPPPVSLRRRPSEMVRRVQAPFTRASTLMRSRQNYGKMNTKRRGKTPPPPRKQRPMSLIMPDEEKPSQEGSFLVSTSHYPELTLSPNVTPVNNPQRVIAESNSDSTPVNIDLGPNSEYDIIPTLIESLPPVDPEAEFDVIPSFIDGRKSSSSAGDTNATPMQTTPVNTPAEVGLVQSIILEAPQIIERCISVPSGMHRLEDRQEEEEEEERLAEVFSTLRGSLSLSSSSPSLFAMGEGNDVGSPYHSQDLDPVQEALDVLHDSLNRLDDVVSSLYVILEFLKEGYWVLTDPTDLDALIKNIGHYLEDLELVDLGSRVLKYITFQALSPADGGGASLSMGAELSLAVCQCVVNVLKLHPHSERVQLSGSQALANLVRLDVSLGDALLDAKMFPHFAATLQLYGEREVVCLSMLNTLASISASVSSAGANLPIGFENVLKETTRVMLLHSHNSQIQSYGLSFITLSLIDVAAQINASLMKDLIKSVINSITVHPMNPDIAVWVCKSLSEVACHEVLQEEAMRESVTDCLFTILAEHSKSSKVQMWASYSLYQQVSYNKSLLPLVQDTGIIEKCQNTLPHLSKEAQSYLQNLTEMASL